MIKHTKDGQIPLALNFSSAEEVSMATFLVAEHNQLPFDCINSLLESKFLDTATFVYLYGTKGVGKTHLVKAIINRALSLNVEAIQLNLSDWIDFQPSAILNELETYDIICIDDIDSVASHPDWEAELFSLYNRWLAKASGLMFVTAQNSSTTSGFQKPEYITRLQSGVTLHLHEPTPEFICKVIIEKERMRGGVLQPEFAQKIVTKLKTLPDCLTALNMLDEQALEHKKGINNRLVSSVLHQFAQK